MAIKNCKKERGWATVEQAKQLIDAEIRSAKVNKITCLKLIHGYGSSGKGGKIKEALPDFLDGKMRVGAIADYIRGEDFSIFDALTQKALLNYPDLSGDKDLNQSNRGITLILMPKSVRLRD